MDAYFDTMVTLACILAGSGIVIGIVGVMWICCRLDQIRDKVEEVLRWM